MISKDLRDAVFREELTVGVRGLAHAVSVHDEEITRRIFLPERYSEPLPQSQREALLSESAIGRDFLAITRRQPFDVVAAAARVGVGDGEAARAAHGAARLLSLQRSKVSSTRTPLVSARGRK